MLMASRARNRRRWTIRNLLVELGRRLMMMLRSMADRAIATHLDHSTLDEEPMAVLASHMAASCRCSILIAHAILQGLTTVSPRFLVRR